MKKTQNLVNAVLNPSAQNEGLCAIHTPEVSSVTSIVNSILAGNELTSQDKAMVELLYISGLRITEALSIKFGSITNDGRIAVKGIKGSNDRLVFPLVTKAYFEHCKTFRYDPFKEKNRFYYYRLFKQKGLFIYRQHVEKNSVTHVFRYNFVIDIKNSGADNNFIKSAIGHRSIKSTEHYVNKKKYNN